MKQAIKKAIRILLTLIQSLLSFAKTAILNTLLYATIISVVAVLAPFIPFILLIVKYFEYRTVKLESLTTPKKTKVVIKPVNKFPYEQQNQNTKP